MAKMIEASGGGFDHETPPEGGVERGYHLISAPHATPELDVWSKILGVNTYAMRACDGSGEPACVFGNFVYRSRIPAHGLAAWLRCRELYRRTRPLGATHMTGGSNPFYLKLVLSPRVVWTTWTK
jgi:hypothetical protein